MILSGQLNGRDRTGAYKQGTQTVGPLADWIKP